jgi:hypothetical protein
LTVARIKDYGWEESNAPHKPRQPSTSPRGASASFPASVLMRLLSISLLFYYMLCEDFVYFIMPWYKLLFTRFRIAVKIMPMAMSQENTSQRCNFSDKVFSFIRRR